MGNDTQNAGLCENKIKFVVTAKVKPSVISDSVIGAFADIEVEGVVVVLRAILADPHNLFSVICVEDEAALQEYLNQLGSLGNPTETSVEEISAKVIKAAVQNGWP